MEIPPLSGMDCGDGTVGARYRSVVLRLEPQAKCNFGGRPITINDWVIDGLYDKLFSIVKVIY
ncbi:hypothetical protein EMIT0P44_20233 [Pseudomonas sp. IT-P44]